MNQNSLSPPQEKSVLDLVRKQRTAPEAVDMIEILKPSAEKAGVDVVKLNNALALAIKQDPKFRIMRANNTLFLNYNLGNGRAEVSMETIDNPRTLIDSIKQYIQAMKKAGFNAVQFEISNPQIIKALEMAGLKVQTKPTNRMMPDGNTPARSAVVEF